MVIKEWFTDFTKLLFPKVCNLCKQDLVSDEQHICSICMGDLPVTNFQFHAENALELKLKGRFDFEAAIAFYYFNTEGKIQEILHQIK